MPFPQHAAGRKHLHKIKSEGRQQELVAHDPELFLRGLFNPDGCRVANWTTRTVAGHIKRYEYPRYMFSNESPDMMHLRQQSVDLLNVRWRLPRANVVSDVRRPTVATLDTFIGPKS